jgi:dihydrofolate synthase/folylpolyglutamate synthase
LDFDPIEYLNAPRWWHVSLGLERMRVLADELGRPQDGLAFLHVAGTNGKGSTCAYLSSICRALGVRTGLFTSPFIERFEERIQVNGEVIAPDDLLEATLRVRDAALRVEDRLGEHPTEFELMFAVALVYFASQGCDICVVEVGLGGRLDATNIIDPLACVITPVSFDHMGVLGDTLAQIAAEKAGIIKPGVPVISAPQALEATQAIKDAAVEAGAPLEFAPVGDAHTVRFEDVSGYANVQVFEYRGRTFATKLLGSYQPANAALAIDTMQCLTDRRIAPFVCEQDVLNQAIAEGVANAYIPGRFEALSSDPQIFVDGAHNPAGARVLADTLAARGIEHATFVLGVMADKDYAGMLSQLADCIGCAYVYTAPNDRALAAKDLATAVLEACPAAKVKECRDAADAVRAAVEGVATDQASEPIIAAGTLYAISEIKRAVRMLNQE